MKFDRVDLKTLFRSKIKREDFPNFFTYYNQSQLKQFL